MFPDDWSFSMKCQAEQTVSEVWAVSWSGWLGEESNNMMWEWTNGF